MSDKYSIFHVEGGVGKNILATAVVSSLKDAFPERKIIVVSAWSEPWLNNPDVYQVYSLNQTSNFYKNFIDGKDVKIYRHNPYFSEDYILRKKHLIEVWCDLLKIKYNGSMPKLYFSPLEIEFLRIKMRNNLTKPIFLLHANGGGNEMKYSWYRDIPLPNVKDIVDYFKEEYHIYQIGLENQMLIEGCVKLTLNNREILLSLMISKKRLLIDSFSQHASVALGIKSVVCWIGNDPNILGYKSNINITPAIEPVYDTYHYSYLEDFDISGNPVQFPYDKLKIFNSEEIINKLISL